MQLFSEDATIFSKNFKLIFCPWKRASKVAHNRPKPFFSQSSQAHSPELIFHIINMSIVPRLICLLICNKYLVLHHQVLIFLGFYELLPQPNRLQQLPKTKCLQLSTKSLWYEQVCLLLMTGRSPNSFPFPLSKNKPIIGLVLTTKINTLDYLIIAHTLRLFISKKNHSLCIY